MKKFRSFIFVLLVCFIGGCTSDNLDFSSDYNESYQSQINDSANATLNLTINETINEVVNETANKMLNGTTDKILNDTLIDLSNLVNLTGVLEVNNNCAIPEGCGPKYLIYYLNSNQHIPLLGNINDNDSGLIVTIYGRLTTLPESEYGVMFYNGPPILAIEVVTYKRITTVHYRKIIGDALAYSLEKYPCLINNDSGYLFTKWEYRYSWNLNGYNPILKIRFAESSNNAESQRFYELWYLGTSGLFFQETKYPRDDVFC
jgi:hypothetical protein